MLPSASALEATPPDFGVYVHVPYCVRRCPYCDFALTPVDAAPADDFTAAAIAEMDAAPAREVAGVGLGARLAGRAAVSLYFGGGTPSMLPPGSIARIVAAARERFGLRAGAEITLEANPEDLEDARLAGWRDAGITRLSLGVQALEDRFLRALGREHDAAQAIRSIERARSAGFAEVSFDLIFAVQRGDHGPAMTLDDWRVTLDRALALSPTHLSCYALTVERGTALDRRIAAGTEALPDEETQAAMYELAVERLAAAGLPRYEVSSFAAPGHRAVHNSLYWRYAEWIGVGPSAHSFLHAGPPGSRDAGGVRFWNDKNPFEYLRTRGRPAGGHEVITGRAAMGEMAFTALRLVDGLSDQAFARVFGETPEAVFGATFARLASRGLVLREGNVTRLTERGYLLSDSVFAELVG